MRDQAELCLWRQGEQQLQRVVDRALGQRAVLKAVDAAGEGPLQHRPQRPVTALQIAKAAQRAGPGAVDEDQHRPGLVGRRPAGLAGGGQFTLTLPAVQLPGRPVQLFFDGPHQRPGAQPGHAQCGGADGRAFGLLAAPCRQLADGTVDDRIGRQHAADQQLEDLADEPAHHIGQHAAGGLVAGRQAVEQHRAVGVQQVGPVARQGLGQAPGAGDQGATVGQFEHQHLVVLAGQRGLESVGPAACSGAQVVGLGHRQVAVGQEGVVSGRRAGRAAGRVQQRRHRRRRHRPAGEAQGRRSGGGGYCGCGCGCGCLCGCLCG